MFASRSEKSLIAHVRQDVENREREEREERLRQSTQCMQSLQKNSIVADNAEWEVKKKGSAPGVILLKNSKSGSKKKVFVKRYEEIFMSVHKDEDLLDLSAFTIIKKCGGRVPKVKLKGISDDKVFLFSTDVSHSQAKHPERKYQFHEFSDDEINVSSWAGVSSTYRIFDKKRDFEIDKISVARMLMLGVILNIWDLHDDNAGIVFSTEGNAKLTFIDFLIYVENLNNEHQLDLDGFIRTYYANMNLDDKLNTLISAITLPDCIKAFKKIEMNFQDSCSDALERINQLPFVAADRKLHMADVFKTWEQNSILGAKDGDEGDKPIIYLCQA